MLQSFVNHGGYVTKLYRSNRESQIFFRPSLPDASLDLTEKFEQYKNGYFKISTDQLLSENYIEFWKKLSNDRDIENLVNKEYLVALSEIFENFSESTLFGLDFIYDKIKNEYYIIDCNEFPGYKEINNIFNDILIKHIVSYYEEFMEKGSIFND